MEGFEGILDLTDRDDSVGSGDYTAVPSGAYDCSVDEIDWRYVENANGSLPEGTPGLNVRFRVSLDEEDRKGIKVSNKCFFNTYWIPPKDYDADKARKMRGALANFLKAAGVTDEELGNKKFNLDNKKDDLEGEELVVVVGKKVNDYHDPPREENPVVGVKPAGTKNETKKAGAVL